MEPRRVTKEGRELGNAAAAALLCIDPRKLKPIKPETFQWYIARAERLAREGRPLSDPPPEHVEVDKKTGQRMYDLDEVSRWQARRRGRGNWGGEGARARIKTIGAGVCPDCRQSASVLVGGVFANHNDETGTSCPRSGGVATRYTETVSAK